MSIKNEEECGDAMRWALDYVHREIIPNLPEGVTPIEGDAEWHLTDAFALANAHGISLSDEMMKLALELEEAGRDVYLPDSMKALAATR